MTQLKIVSILKMSNDILALAAFSQNTVQPIKFSECRQPSEDILLLDTLQITICHYEALTSSTFFNNAPAALLHIMSSA